MLKKIFSFLNSRKLLIRINIIGVVLGLFSNHFFQGFCIPSLWSSLVIAVSLIFVILSPLPFFSKSDSGFVGFLAGISFSSFVYCIIFLAHINWYAFPLVFFGIGIILLIPHIFAFQLLKRFFISTNFKIIRQFFVLGVVSCFFVSVFAGLSYRNAMSDIKAMKESNYSKLDTNFMTEKILGMHFIYHTEICEYDGWRPPIHEPLLVMGMWWNSMEDPISIALKYRLALYKTVFPNNPVKFNCSCAVIESKSYHQDELWNSL